MSHRAKLVVAGVVVIAAVLAGTGTAAEPNDRTLVLNERAGAYHYLASTTRDCCTAYSTRSRRSDRRRTSAATAIRVSSRGGTTASRSSSQASGEPARKGRSGKRRGMGSGSSAGAGTTTTACASESPSPRSRRSTRRQRGTERALRGRSRGSCSNDASSTGSTSSPLPVGSTAAGSWRPSTFRLPTSTDAGIGLAHQGLPP